MASTQEELEDVVLSARYGEVDEIKAFAEQHGWDALVGARDERGNTVLHMACGNGHADVLELVVAHIAPSLLTQTNEAGSPPLHWAVLNNHVACVKLLVELPEERGGGLHLLKQTNGAGRDAFAESIFAGEGKEEVSGWIEGYLFRAEGGEDDDAAAAGAVEGGEGAAEVETADTESLVEQTGGLSVADKA
ncbi:ankyrin repeat-containing protein [Cryptotrichosporon argae]